ncbi:MAG: hypothetical protein ACI4KR_09265 [Ruminiclostridium sp.]
MCGSLYKSGDVVFLRPDLRTGVSYRTETSNSKQDRRVDLLTNRNHTSLVGQALIIDKVLSGFYCGFQYITYTVVGHCGEFSASMFSDYEERINPSATYISFYDYLGGDNNAEGKV